MNGFYITGIWPTEGRSEAQGMAIQMLDTLLAQGERSMLDLVAGQLHITEPFRGQG